MSMRCSFYRCSGVALALLLADEAAAYIAGARRTSPRVLWIVDRPW